ncbi:MAG: hypothetical protein K8R21_15000 [Leptospira sp.]|nr:hypothetical protein [Leptospira sp.]
MKILRSVIVYFLSIAIFVQSALFGSGLFACMLNEQAMYCSCNHSSKKEIHPSHRQNREDNEFRNKNRSGIKVTAGELNLPDCHKAKSGEVHLCACKKSKKSFETIFPQVTAFYTLGSATESIFGVILYSDIFNVRFLMSGSLHDPGLIKPPKISPC